MRDLLVDLLPVPAEFASLNLTNMCICPQALLERFDLDSGEPMVLMVEGVHRCAYLTPHQFHAEASNILFVPQHVIELFADEVYIQIRPAVGIPTITRMTVEALEPEQATKEMFELDIPRRYQVIHLNDVLRINDWSFKVVKLEPQEVVRTFCSDPEISFVPFKRKQEVYSDWIARANKDVSMWKQARLSFAYSTST